MTHAKQKRISACEGRKTREETLQTAALPLGYRAIRRAGQFTPGPVASEKRRDPYTWGSGTGFPHGATQEYHPRRFPVGAVASIRGTRCSDHEKGTHHELDPSIHDHRVSLAPFDP